MKRLLGGLALSALLFALLACLVPPTAHAVAPDRKPIPVAKTAREARSVVGSRLTTTCDTDDAVDGAFVCFKTYGSRVVGTRRWFWITSVKGYVKGDASTLEGGKCSGNIPAVEIRWLFLDGKGSHDWTSEGNLCKSHDYKKTWTVAPAVRVRCLYHTLRSRFRLNDNGGTDKTGLLWDYSATVGCP